MTLTYPSNVGGIVNDPAQWASSAGYEFWIVFGHLDLMTVMGATNVGLSGAGWTGAIAANASITEGSTGDFLSSADIDPTRIVIGSTNMLLSSPRIFGSYDHGLMARRFLGYLPTKLCCEFYARFSVASANEATSYIGFGSPSLANVSSAGGAGGVTSNGTNFLLISDLGSDPGAAIDTAWHLWRIEVGPTNTEWFIDDVSQGTITTETDIWPTCFNIVSGVTNRPQLAWARVYYV